VPDGSASYFTDRSHILLSGVSGSRTDYGGKTGVANWWATTHGRAAFDLVVFFNAKQDAAPGEHAETEVGTVRELAEAMRAGHRHICLTPTDPDWEAVHERLAAFVRELPKDLDKLVVHDEAPEYDGESLLWFLRVAGNGSNCKSIVIAQAPGDLDTAARRQLVTAWVGPLTEQNRHYFRANNYLVHYREMKEDHEPYNWSVITGPSEEDRDHYSPVPEEYA